ncbi:MAG: hypothetical protein HC886_16045, partial [Leptolyngbyaceae cyanobacterium SM1_1_3]|nr:hypothetical protein [Leptolyngbyaceae cyanobacterium SM1_1_3]
MNRSQRQPLRLPLRGVLVIPFLLQLTAAVGLTGYFSLRNGQQAVNRLAEQLLSATKQLVNQHLDSYLELPQKANQINANLIQQGVLDLNDLETIGQ